MQKVVSILLPFFPNSNYLREKWWHRLVLVISSFLSVIAIFLFLLCLKNWIVSCLEMYKVNKLGKELNTEIIHKTNSSLEVSGREVYNFKRDYTHEEYGEKVKQDFVRFDKYKSELIGKAAVHNYPKLRELVEYSPLDYRPPWNSVVLAGIFITLGIIIPNIIYRTFLYVITAGEWQD